jgi:hypothetical protein
VSESATVSRDNIDICAILISLRIDNGDEGIVPASFRSKQTASGKTRPHNNVASPPGGVASTVFRSSFHLVPLNTNFKLIINQYEILQ